MHGCREKLHSEIEPVEVAVQLVAKIAVTGCRGRRDYSHTLGQQRERKLFVQIYDTLVGEALHDEHTLARHISDSVGRLNVANVERKAVELVEVHAYLQQHFEADGKFASRLLKKVGAQQRIDTRPYCSASLCRNFAGSLVALYKLNVAMADRGCANLGKLARHPIFQRKLLLDCRSHHAIEARERQGIFTAHYHIRLSID